MHLKQLDLHFAVADTARRFLTARRFDPNGALTQFEEAHRFREENHIIRLYDLIKISDYEQARQLVSERLFVGIEIFLTLQSVSPLDGS